MLIIQKFSLTAITYKAHFNFKTTALLFYYSCVYYDMHDTENLCVCKRVQTNIVFITLCTFKVLEYFSAL